MELVQTKRMKTNSQLWVQQWIPMVRSLVGGRRPEKNLPPPSNASESNIGLSKMPGAISKRSPLRRHNSGIGSFSARPLQVDLSSSLNLAFRCMAAFAIHFHISLL
eukprot:4770611-Pyramimonas_sp.AAC.1